MNLLVRWRINWRVHVVATGALVAVWLALWGRVTVPLLAAGIVLSAAILLAFPLPPVTTSFRLHPLRSAATLARFLADVAAASLQISYFAVRPTPPASDVVTVELLTNSDLIQHLTALAVSLVPGSLIIAADPTERTLTIHVLYSSPRSAERFTAEVLAQEARIRWALGEGDR